MNTENTMQISDGMTQAELAIKRLTDILLAAAGLILLFPVFVIITLLLQCQHNGPVFFRQRRIGYHGKAFTIYKFRTISSEIEEEKPQLMANCDANNSTRLEQFLRSHHLDELPQLWNVLRGDMSFVGPRPERLYFIRQIMAVDKRYEQIYRMRPGITSEASIYNGYTDSLEKMIRRMEMDLDYLRRRSLWIDLKIIIKTVTTLIQGKKI